MRPKSPPRPCAECGAPLSPRRSRYCSDACWFWNKFDRSGGPSACWPWKGYVSPRDGYGHVGAAPGRKRTSAHRMAFRIAKGDPGPLLVRHECDNRACGNPRHLRVGSHKDNTLDAHARNRPIVARPGEANRWAKLTEAAVREIRASTEPSTVLGPRYGVVPSRIRSIRRGEGWKHV